LGGKVALIVVEAHGETGINGSLIGIGGGAAVIVQVEARKGLRLL